MVNHLSVGVNTFNKNAFSDGQSGLARARVSIPQCGRLQSELWHHHVFRASTWGIVVKRDRAAAGFDQGRPDAGQRVAHTQVRLHVRSTAGEWLWSTRSRRPGRLQLSRNRRARRDHTCHRRRQFIREIPGWRRRYRPDRDHPVSAAGLSLLRVLRAGRLAGEQQKRLSTTGFATTTRAHREPAAINTPISRRPSRIQRSMVFLARWCLPVKAPGAKARAACSNRSVAHGCCAPVSRIASTTRPLSAVVPVDRSDVSPSCKAAAISRGSSASTCSRPPTQG